MSPQIETLTGYSPEEWVSERDFFGRALHPEDRERVLATFAAVDDSLELVQIEYRLVAKDGRVIWIHDEAAVARDDDGHPMYVQGYLADVTRRRRATSSFRRPRRGTGRSRSSCRLSRTWAGRNRTGR